MGAGLAVAGGDEGDNTGAGGDGDDGDEEEVVGAAGVGVAACGAGSSVGAGVLSDSSGIGGEGVSSAVVAGGASSYVGFDAEGLLYVEGVLSVVGVGCERVDSGAASEGALGVSLPACKQCALLLACVTKLCRAQTDLLVQQLMHLCTSLTAPDLDTEVSHQETSLPPLRLSN